LGTAIAIFVEASQDHRNFFLRFDVFSTEKKKKKKDCVFCMFLDKRVTSFCLIDEDEV
jgi:hypothetical protein